MEQENLREGVNISSNFLGGVEAVEPVAIEDDFPTIDELVNAPGYSELPDVRKAYALSRYKVDLAKHLVQIGEVRDQEGFTNAVQRIDKALDEYMPSGNSFSAMWDSRVDHREILSELIGMGGTARIAGKAGRLRNDFRHMATADLINNVSGPRFHVPTVSESENYIKKFDAVYQDFEDVRKGLELGLQEDKDIRGRDEILANGISASTFANAGSRMAMDIPLAISSAAAYGPAGPISYFSLVGAARSDRAQRMAYPERSATNRFGRSAFVGTASGALEMLPFGYLTNGFRAGKLANIMKMNMPSALQRVGAAALAEGATEFAQAILERFGHDVEALDDIITIMSDSETWTEALKEAGVGAIMGGGVKGTIEISMPALERVIQTETFQKAHLEIRKKLEKVDLTKRIAEPISDLSKSIIETSKLVNQESNNLKNLEESREAGQAVGQAIAEDATKRDLPIPEEAGFGVELDGRFEKSDILTAQEAREQGENPEVQNSNVERKDFIPKNQAQPIESIIRQSIIENGGIDIAKSSYFKDSLQDADSNPLFSPKFRSKNGQKGLPLDEHIEILAEQGLVPRDVNPDAIIDALNGSSQDLQAMQNSQPSLEDLEILAQQQDPNAEFNQEVDNVLFDMLPNKSQRSATVAAVPKNVLASESSQPNLGLKSSVDRVNVNTLPLSMTDLTRLSSNLMDNPVAVKKMIRRNPGIQGTYSPDGIELKAGIAAGPEIKSYKSKVTRDRAVQDVMNDDAILKEYPGIKEDDIILRDNGNGISVHKRDHDYAGKVFAHEIGHLIDDIDSSDLEERAGVNKRGNMLGRLQGLKNFLKPEILTIDGSIKDSEIKSELKQVTQHWKPFDENADKKYTNYRHKGEELYADAVSVLFNNPGLLAGMAPKFYKTFNRLLSNKPDVKSAFDSIQKSRKTGQTADNNLDDVISMMQEAGAVKDIDKPEGLISKIKGLVKTVRGEVLNTRAEHIDYKKRNKISDQVYDKFEDSHLDFLHASGMASGYLSLQRNFLEGMKESGIAQAEFDAYMFLQLTANERSDFFNPLGLRGKESVDTLDALKKRMGEKFNKLPELQKKFNEARKIVKKVISESGIVTDALMDKINSNDNYVRFDVIGDDIVKNFNDRGSAKIMKVVGTLKELKESPFEKTVQQDMALMHLSYLNTAKKSLVNDLVLPGDRVEAELSKPGGYKKFRGKDQELVTYLDKGQIKGYYIDKKLAQLYDGNVRGASIIKYSSIAMSPVKALWVKYSPAFALRNTPRDFAMSWKQMGDTYKKVPSILRPFVQGFSLAKEYASVAPEVFKSAYLGQHSDYILNMELAGEIHLSDPGGVGLNEDYDTEAERMFAEKLGTLAKDQSLFKKILSAIPNTGRFTELWTRRAGKAMLEKHSNLSKKEITRQLRHTGSPDFLDGGYQKRLLNSIFVFSNANLMGLRQNFEAAKKDPLGYMYKTAVWNVLPVTIAYMAMKGLMGDDQEEFYNKVDELDLTHSIIIPLGMNEEGEAKYIRIAQDHFGAMFSQMAWGFLNDREDEIFNSVQSQIPFSGENVNPIVRIGFETLAMASDRSPVDHYNRQVVDKNLMGTKEGWKDFGRYQWNSVLGQQLKLDTKDDSGIKNIPFITSLSKAMYRETDNGIVQKEIREAVDSYRDRGGYIASYISELPNNLTKAEVKREARKSYYKYENKKDVKMSTYIRSFLIRYRKVKVMSD